MKWKEYRTENYSVITPFFSLRAKLTGNPGEPWYWQTAVTGAPVRRGWADTPEAARAAAEAAYRECMVREIHALSNEDREKLFDALREVADAGERVE